jgi:Fe-S-cluster containining protein
MSQCDSCHAGCCRSFAVPVTGADVLRIERELGLAFWDFVCRWADPHGSIARKHAPHFYFADEPQTPFVVCLTHAKSHYLNGTSKCRFLNECQPDAEHPLGVARCGIYASRPMACRAFPTKLNQTGELAIIYDIPSHGRNQENAVYDLCPGEWKPSDLDPLQTVQDLVVAKYEMAFFHQLARLWNRAPRSWSLFPDFLTLAYSGRIIREEDAAENAEPETIKFPAVRTGFRTAARRAA